MKKPFSGPKKLNKGAPSGFVISLIFHAVAFFVAGLFVVFTVLPKEEPEFKAPPPVERPKMKLKKPKVKVKKSSQPKPSSRIVAKVKTAKMPEIQIPDLVGTGEGLLGGLGTGGDFMDLPAIPDTNIFGSETSTGNDLVGVYYDMNRTRDGLKKVLSRDDNYVTLHKFFERDWNTATFSQFYKSPKKLYTSTICIGTVQSSMSPEAFGEYDTEGWGWAVLYKGKLVYPDDIRFRFRGVGDKINAVRVDGKVVLMCVYRNDRRAEFSDIWDSNDGDNRVYTMSEDHQTVGDWIELKAGETKDIEVLLAEPEGGLVYHQLVVEVDGKEYPRDQNEGGPTFPVFRTDILPRELIDALMVDVYPGDVGLTNNGPIFCDYIPEMMSLNQPLPTNPPPPFAKNAGKLPRTWTSVSGQTVEGKMMTSTSEYVMLEKPDKSQLKIPLDQLSQEDQRFVALANPPKLDIEFSKRSDQVPNPTQSPYDSRLLPLSIFDYTFGARVKKISSSRYNHKLKIEYFAILDEYKGDRYILAERKSDTFTPSKENKFSHEFYGRKIPAKEYGNRTSAPIRGKKYKGHNLIVVTDEEGNLVDYRASNEFLFENLEKLRALPINSYFDKNCERVYPTRPTQADRRQW